MIRSIIAALLFLVSPAFAAPIELLAKDLEVEAHIARGGDFIGFGFDSVWMMSLGALVRVESSDNSVVDIMIDPQPRGPFRGMPVGEGGVWIPDTGLDTITKIDPETNAAALTIPVKMFGSEGTIGLGEGSVWVTSVSDRKPTLMRYDAATGAEQARIAMPMGDAVAVAFGSVWVTSTLTAAVYRIDPSANAIAATIPTAAGPVFLTAGFESIWVIALGDGLIQRIDPATNAVIASIETGGHLGGDILIGAGYVWATYADGTPLVQIDPGTNEVRQYRGNEFGDALAFGAGSIWISGRDIARIAPPDWR